MIKIYQTSEGLCVNEQDLGKLLDVTNGTVYGFIFCGNCHNRLPQHLSNKYRETSYWEIKAVNNALEDKLKYGTSISRLSKYKKARIEYLIDYLNKFIKGVEPQSLAPYCING